MKAARDWRRLLACAVALVAVLGAARASQNGAAERDPRKLPRATAERWSGWTGQQVPPDALRPALSEIVQSYREQAYGVTLERCWALLEREPDFPPALYQLGIVYFRLRRYGDAAVALERFLELAPLELATTQVLGHCYYSLGDYGRAQAHYERILELDARASLEVRRGLALCHVRQGALERGLELLDLVLREKPDYADVHAWRAQVLYDMDQSEASLAAAERARELDPFEPRGHFLAAQALRDLGRTAEAAAAEQRFRELNEIVQRVRTLEAKLLHESDIRPTLTRLASLHQAARNAAELERVIDRLVKLDSKDLSTRLFALATLQAGGALPAARACAASIERDFAEQAQAWQVLRDFYGEIGDTVRQIQAGERYLRLGGERGR
jgi:tetratricopeptide (TPR) repeat protein